MTDLDKKEIRGVTLPIIRTFIVGTVAVCGTLIGAAEYIKINFALLEYRMTKAEATISKHVDQIEALLAQTKNK